MSEENNKPQEIKTEEVTVEEVKAEEAKTEGVNPGEIRVEEVKKSIPESDLSKIKVKDVLGQRIKKHGVRKIISYLLVAIIFFCGGLMADRFIIRHKVGRGFYGKPGIQRGVPGNSFDNRRPGGSGQKKGQQPPADSGASQDQNQGSSPADGQKQ